MLREGRPTSKVLALKEHARERGEALFDDVTELAEAVRDEDELGKPYDHHLSRRGNEVLAQRPAAWLAERGLLPPGRGSPTPYEK